MANKALFVTTGGGIKKRAGFPETYSTSDPIRFKRGDATTLRIGFLNEDSVWQTTTGAGADAGEAASTKVIVGLKEDGKYDTASFVASGSVVGIDANGYYVVELNLNNATLDALLAKDGNDANDIASVELMFEITWSISGGASGATDWRTTNLIHAVIENDVVRTDEADVVASAVGLLWQKGADAVAQLIQSALVVVDDEGGSTSFAIAVDSTSYAITDLLAARLNTDLNSKPAYGTGQPSDATDITSTPSLDSNSEAVHCWWDGSEWNLHLYTGGVWEAGWTSSDAVADPSLVTTWTADTVTYPTMTDDLTDVTIDTGDATLVIPNTWTQHGRQLEIFAKSTTGKDVIIAREDSSFTIAGGASTTIVDGSKIILAYNANASTPDWLILDYDQDASGDIGWIP